MADGETWVRCDVVGCEAQIASSQGRRICSTHARRTLRPYMPRDPEPPRGHLRPSGTRLMLHETREEVGEHRWSEPR